VRPAADSLWAIVLEVTPAVSRATGGLRTRNGRDQLLRRSSLRPLTRP
jgi:hypothetical protein